jgi:hypothetical protein
MSDKVNKTDYRRDIELTVYGMETAPPILQNLGFATK